MGKHTGKGFRESIPFLLAGLSVLFLLALAACSSDNDTFTIGPDGGTISSNGVTIVIPAGALETTVEFSISAPTGLLPVSNNIIGAPVTISPDTVFLKPATVSLPYVLSGGVYQLNTYLAALEAGAWLPFADSTVDLDNKTVTAEVLHFSTFAPYWYEPPAPTPQGYYLNVMVDNEIDGAAVTTTQADNTFYNDDGKTAAFGAEGTDVSTWTPFNYTMQPDGLLKVDYRHPAPDGHLYQEFGVFNPLAKVDAYFETSAVDSYSLLLFGFEKPSADYLPSLAGKSYFFGGYQSSPTDTNREVYSGLVEFEDADSGQMTDNSGGSYPFSYAVAAGGAVTLNVQHPGETVEMGMRLNGDATLSVDAYANTETNTVGLAVGARLSTGKTNADLSGEYHAMLYVADFPEMHVLYMSMNFDGQGGGSFLTYDEQLEEVMDSGDLTYSVNDDGTFVLNLLDFAEQQDELCVLSPDNNVFIEPDFYGSYQTFTIGVKKTVAIGVQGGTVQENGATLAVPAGALTEDRIIGVSPAVDYPADGEIIGAPATFGPDAIFRTPATVALPYVLPGGVLQTNAVLAALEAGAWSPIPESAVDLTDKTVSADVLHLSTYAPYWYERPVGVLEGYYFSAFLNNRTGYATADMNNSLYADDGRSASFGVEGTDPADWTPYQYTIRADGLLRANHDWNDEPIKQFGVVNAASKAHAYFQTRVVDSRTLILFGFEKPAADYQPSLAGESYFFGGYQSSPTDTNPEVYTDVIEFEDADSGQITDAGGASYPLTYVVAPGGEVTLTVQYTGETRELGMRLNGDASLSSYSYENSEKNTVGFGVGVRLSSGKTNADLVGAFHTMLYLADDPDSHVLYRSMVFDGQGGGTYETWDEELEAVTGSGTLTYAVSDDGTFTMTLSTVSEGQSETCVLSPDNNVFVDPDIYGSHETLTIGVKKSTLVGPLGGTIREGGATLAIPAGALSGVSLIGVSPANEYPADGNIIGQPVRIAPPQAFLEPASLTLPFELPGGVYLLNASLAVLQAGAWSPLPGTTVDISQRSVTASILEGSTFAPYWYEPSHALTGYYVNASLQNMTGGAQAAVDNTLYNDDGRTAAFGYEGTELTTWTPIDYTLRSDGLLMESYFYPAPDGTFIQEFGVFNPDAKVDAYFQPGAAGGYTSILFGFEKPASDYQPSLEGAQYLAGVARTDPTDTQYGVSYDLISFDTAQEGHLTQHTSAGVSESTPFTYTVADGGVITMTVAFPEGQQVFGSRLNPDASLLVYAYQTTDDIYGLVVGARLSSGKTDADLVGEYHAMLYLPASPDSHVLYRSMTFDGQGGGSYVTYDKKLEEITDSGALTYSMSGDGTFTMTLSTVSEGQSETCILSPDNNVFVDPDYYAAPSFTIGVKKLSQ